MTLKIIASQCTSCSACEPECPNVAIYEKNGTFVINPKKCTECKAETCCKARHKPMSEGAEEDDVKDHSLAVHELFGVRAGMPECGDLRKKWNLRYQPKEMH